jgi:hypothetical protein
VSVDAHQPNDHETEHHKCDVEHDRLLAHRLCSA